jgi:hypothetical protein
MNHKNLKPNDKCVAVNYAIYWQREDKLYNVQTFNGNISFRAIYDELGALKNNPTLIVVDAWSKKRYNHKTIIQLLTLNDLINEIHNKLRYDSSLDVKLN